jgi:hypothetical protein
MIDKNIATITKATQELEKQLCETEMTAGAIVTVAKQFLENMNATNLLLQIKAAQKPLVKPVESKILTM